MIGVSGGFLLGNLFTPIDCRVWDVLDQIQTLMSNYPNLYKTYPLTSAFISKVAARPNIAEYLKHRK